MDRPARRPPARRALTAAAVVGVLVALAVAGLVRSAGTDGPVTDGERARAVATSLRCPTCQGLSVADSNSPLAKSMREIIDERVAAGESNEEITQYFVDRYSDWVLLSPRADGVGWLVWAVPGAAVLVGLLVVTSLVRRRHDRGFRTLRWVGVGGLLAVSLGVLVATNLDGRGADELATGNVTPLGSQGSDRERSGEAVPPAGAGEAGSESADSDLVTLQAAVDADPDDVRARLALASAAFQTGQLDLTREQAEAALDREPRNVDALMLRGLGARSEDDRDAVKALREFLRLAPADHPAVPLVRGLMEAS